jgi:methionine-rich copper-binding protein CopC
MAHRTSRLVGVLLTVIAATLVATATPALAHNSLKSSDPKAGAVLDAAPKAVTLTFTEELTPGTTTVTITGPDGSPASGDAAVAGATVSVPFKAIVAGAYKVTYKVTARDGFATSNTLSFSLSPAAILTTTTPPPTTTTITTTTTVPAPTTSAQAVPAPQVEESGTPWWPFALGGLVVVALGVFLVARRRGSAS